MERVRGGDEQAEAILESLLFPELTKYAAWFAPDLSETDQEAIAERSAQEAVRKIARFDPSRASFPTWARLQVRNQASDLRRHPERWGKPARDGWSAPASILEELELDLEHPERILAKEREAEALAEVVGDLRPEDVEIMRLWSTGRSTAQIARALGIKEGAVRT